MQSLDINARENSRQDVETRKIEDSTGPSGGTQRQRYAPDWAHAPYPTESTERTHGG